MLPAPGTAFLVATLIKALARLVESVHPARIERPCWVIGSDMVCKAFIILGQGWFCMPRQKADRGKDISCT